jgi:hypothetical protein
LTDTQQRHLPQAPRQKHLGGGAATEGLQKCVTFSTAEDLAARSGTGKEPCTIQPLPEGITFNTIFRTSDE